MNQKERMCSEECLKPTLVLPWSLEPPVGHERRGGNRTQTLVTRGEGVGKVGTVGHAREGGVRGVREGLMREYEGNMRKM